MSSRRDASIRAAEQADRLIAELSRRWGAPTDEIRQIMRDWVESESEPPGSELVVDGRDLVAAAERRTAGEQFTAEDFDLMMEGVAKNTRLTLRRAWKHVLTFTGENGYMECPMPVETCVKLFHWAWRQTGRYGRPYSPESVRLMMWAITKAHKVAMRPDGIRGYVSPVDSVEVQRSFAAYRKRYVTAGFRPDIATPIAPDELVDMVGTCDTRSPIGLRDALALALLYDAGFRAGELVAADEDRPGVLFRDVELRIRDAALVDVADWQHPATIRLWHPDGDDGHGRPDHMVIHVPMSKTDQEGFGDEVILYAHPEASASTCPVRLFIAWKRLLHERGLLASGPVLRQVLHGGKPPADGRPKNGTVVDDGLTYDGLVRLFTRAVKAAGLENPEGRRRHFVLHGMRAGSAEAAAERGADTPEMNRHYRWSQRGTTAQRYAARGQKRRHNPARRIWTPRTTG